MELVQVKKEWIIIAGRLYVLWQYDMNADKSVNKEPLGQKVNHQIFMSAIFHDQILDLNTPVLESESPEKARKLLYDLAGSLKMYDGPLDLPALAKTLR